MAHQIGTRALMWVGAVAIAPVVAWQVLGAAGLSLVAVELVAGAAILVLERRAGRKIDHYIQGACGEERVGRALAAAEADGWFALHDVDLGHGNVDHIAVGPGGLLTIETKSRPGRVRADDLPEIWLRQAYRHAKKLERVTGQRVEPLLVMSDAYLDRALSNQRGVLVLPARMLPGHLRRRPSRLRPDEVHQLYVRLAAALDRRAA